MSTTNKTLSPLENNEPLIRNVYNDKMVQIELADFDDDEIKVSFDKHTSYVTVTAESEECESYGECDEDCIKCEESTKFHYGFYIPDWANDIDSVVHEGLVTIKFKKRD